MSGTAAGLGVGPLVAFLQGPGASERYRDAVSKRAGAYAGAIR
jgi:hypothetical protein